MTKTTANDLSIEAARAAEELQAAKDKARKLEAQAQLAEQQRKDKTAADRAKFEQQRRDEFGKNYSEPVQQLRQQFTEAVITGGNTVKAWIDYMEAVHKAVREESRFTNFFYNRELERYESIAKQVSEWNTELSHFDNTGYVRAPYDPGTEPRGPWTVAVESIAAKIKRQTGKPANRIQQINNELNALAKALDAPVKRELDDTSWINVSNLINKPQGISFIHQDRYERRTYTQALHDTIDQHLQQVDQQHGEAFRADFNTYQDQAR